MIRIIKEDYEQHDTLNPKLFDLKTNKLKQDVLFKLQEIAEEFLAFIAPLTLSVIDIQLVGSNVAYNYQEGKSDVDLHIIVNFDLNYIDDTILQSIYNDKKNSFNDKYDLSIEGIPVELYIEDVKAGNATNGIYSVLNNEWVKEPEKVKLEIPDYSKGLKEARRKINEVMQSDDIQLIEDTINSIYMQRKTGLAKEGEASISNLIFKELRNDGSLEGLRNKYYELKSKELSIE